MEARPIERRSPPAWRLGAALFFLALIVRLMPLGLYVTPDEPIWVLRSTQFLDAARAGDWTEMPQTGHPGLTTMTLGALGIWLRSQLNPQVSARHLDWIEQLAWLAPENDDAFEHLAFFLTEGRMLVASVTSMGIAGIYILGRRRLNERTARLLGLFLALDPFFAGHSALLHTDALQATFLMLAAVSALPVRQWRTSQVTKGYSVENSLSLVGAALFLALAGLTKTLALTAAPGLAFALLIFGEGSRRKRLICVTTLTVLTTLFFLALYPPFWLAPRAAVEALINAVTYHEGVGLRPTFFWGEERFNPGPAFYPLVLLFRMTPPVLLGLVLRAVRWPRSEARRDLEPLSLDSIGWFALPIVAYLMALTIATKKFDRYALSVLLLLTPIGAAYWSKNVRRWRNVLLPTLLLPWALVAIVPLHYASPLLGGPWVAQYIVPLGWGENSGLVARALNSRLSEPASATLMTRNVPGAASIFAGCAWAWDETRLPCATAVVGYEGVGLESHVPLMELKVAGRRLSTIYIADDPSEAEIPVLAAGRVPGVPSSSVPPITDTASLQGWVIERFGSGEPFLWIHTGTCYPLSEAQLRDALRVDEADSLVTCVPTDTVMGLEGEYCRLSNSPPPHSHITQFGGAVDLLAAAWNEQAQAPDRLPIHLRWLPHQRLGRPDVYFALQAEHESLTWLESGERLISEQQWAASNWQPGIVTDVEVDLSLPLELPPGEYQLVMGLIDDVGWIGHTLPDGTFGGIELVLGTVQVDEPAYPASRLNLPLSLDIDVPGLRILGAVPPSEEIWAGSTADFQLGLERSPGVVMDDLTWNVRCRGGESDEGALAWGPADPNLWTPDYRYIMRFAPRLRPDLPHDVCSLVLVLPDQREVSIGEIRVRQRDHIFELSRKPDVPLAVMVGAFAELEGADLSATEVIPGGTISVALYWHAYGAAERDYTVFVHVVGPDGRVWGQSDSYPMGGGAPTTSWIADEFIVDQHSIKLHEEAPSGRYAIRVGLYDVKRGARVTLSRDGAQLTEGQARIATLSVTQ